MENIIKAQRTDKKRILEILVEAFWNDPHINWFTGRGDNKRKRIEAMMSHAFEAALVRRDVYLSKDRQAVAIWRNSSKNVSNFYTIWENLKFLYQFGIKKVNDITKLENLVQQSYPKGEEFYYLFVIGTSQKGRGKGLSSKLMNHILSEADRKGIHTYLETANSENIAIYNKKGFRTYKEMEVSGKNPITLHLMSREPRKVEISPEIKENNIKSELFG